MSGRSGRLTVSGDLDGSLLPDATTFAMHTGQVLTLVQGQTEAVRQSASQHVTFGHGVHGRVIPGAVGEQPGEVGPGFALAHGQPEWGVLLSNHVHAQQTGFW